MANPISLESIIDADIPPEWPKWRFGDDKGFGIRICSDCEEVDLEFERHLCPGPICHICKIPLSKPGAIYCSAGHSE